MADKNLNLVGIGIAAAVMVLIGVIFVSVIADEQVNKVQLEQQTDTLTLIKIGATQANNYTTDYQLTKLDDAWRETFPECAKATLATGTNIIIYNSTGSEMSNNGACGAGENGNEYYIVEGASTLNICNDESVNDTVNTFVTVRYDTCPSENYVGGWAQTIFKLIPGFFALAILIGAAFVITRVLKSENIDIGI